MWSILADLAREADKDDRVKVMVIRGADASVFCAGADVAEWAERLSGEPTEVRNGEAITAGISAVANMRKPTVAAIQGPCMGGGAAISMACDLRVADQSARFCLPPARVGLAFPFAALRSLVAAVGETQAKWLLFTGEIFDAERALRIGLLSALYDTGSFQSELNNLLTLLCDVSQDSLRAMKGMMKMVAGGQTTDSKETERIWAELTAGPDHAEGVRAFLQEWRSL
jgi:enoyl-CoA hydratase/carnithine racemase